MMGIADGHGAHGHLVSNFVKVNLPKILTELIQTGGKQSYVDEAYASPARKKAKKNGVGFLPPLGRQRQNRGLYDVDNLVPYQEEAYQIQSENEANSKSVIGEQWLSNENHKDRDFQIKEAFKRTEKRLVNKSRIDAMFSGTTCVITLFDNDMIVCANSGDSRAILISEKQPGDNVIATNGKYYCTQLSRDHKPDLPDEAARIIKKNGRIEPSRATPEMMFGLGGLSR